MWVLSCVQVKSVCEEQLSLVKNADCECGLENITTSQLTVSSSQASDADLTMSDQTNSRKYYEVCSLKCRTIDLRSTQPYAVWSLEMLSTAEWRVD